MTYMYFQSFTFAHLTVPLYMSVYDRSKTLFDFFGSTYMYVIIFIDAVGFFFIYIYIVGYKITFYSVLF